MHITTDRPGIKVPPRRAIVADHKEVRERWPKWLKDTFNAVGPAAVWIGGSRDLISCTVHHEDGTTTRFGHNRLSRPVKIGLTESWRDTVTQRLDQVPFWWQGLLTRVWCVSDAHAQRLSFEITEWLQRDAELNEPRRDFIDIGPDLEIETIERRMFDAARALGFECWTDDGLVSWLTEKNAQIKEQEAKSASRRGRVQ